jgi:primosomal replication protein N
LLAVRAAPQVNTFELLAVVVQVQTLRYTPAGIPVLNLVLEHESQQVEVDTPRTVKLQIRAVVFGSQAETLARQPLMEAMEFRGFIANARANKGVVFHIQSFSKT